MKIIGPLQNHLSSKDTKLQRLYVLLKYSLPVVLWLGLIGIGVLTGYRLPCTFYIFTKFQCPGCGMTRAVLALLHGQIYEAFRFNPLVVLLPSMGLLFGRESYLYIKYAKSDKWLPILLCILVFILLGFTLVRNIK